MKNKKIWLSVILSVLALAMVFSLAACSAGDAKESATADKSVTESATATATEAPGSATEASSEEETETDKVAREGLWESAIYLSDKSFGSGATVIEVEVIAEGKSVTFTLHTDAETLGEALVAEKLVEGETSQYGLYIKKVNGMTADYSVDATWWGITKNGVDLPTGADSEKITSGAHYEFTYCK